MWSWICFGIGDGMVDACLRCAMVEARLVSPARTGGGMEAGKCEMQAYR